MFDTSKLDPSRFYLLGCESGVWVAEPIPTDGDAVRATLKAAKYVQEGHLAAALESLRYRDE